MPGELLAGVGVAGERHGLADVDVADVGLVDRGPHLHPLQVAGQQEQAGRVEARLHRLADGDAAVDDDALDRRLDDGVAEVDLVLVELGLGGADVRLGVVGGGLVLLDLHVGLRQGRLVLAQLHLAGVVGRLVGVVVGRGQRLLAAEYWARSQSRLAWS